MVRARIIGLMASTGLLISCDRAPSVPEEVAIRATTSILEQVHLGTDLSQAKLWLMNGREGSRQVCGTIPGPPYLGGERLRFIYDDAGGHGQIELHDGWQPDILGAPALAQNRQLFDGMWSNYCEPFEPWF